MNQDRTVVIAAVAAGVFAIGGWVVLPYLQAPAAAVEQEAALHVERARRLLHQYTPALAYGAAVSEQLHADVNVAEAIEEIAEDRAEEYQAAHEARWAAYEPRDWEHDEDTWEPKPPRPARATYGNIGGQIREGLAERDQVNSANTRLLDEAIREIEAALAVSSGEAAARNDLEANQLKGIILLQKGIAERMHAEVQRQQAEWRRRELIELAETAAKNASSLNLIADSNIDETIAAIEKQMSEAEARLAERRGELQKVEEQVSAFEKRVADTRSRAGSAHDRLEQLKADGVNFTDVNGAKAFEQQINALNDEYTKAMREAHVLEFGGYPKAEIDHSGDYVRGRYVEGGSATELTVDKGLRHYTTDRDVLAAKVNKETEGLANLRADLDALRQTRAEYEQAETEAKARIAELSPKAAEAHQELSRIASEASALEEKALDYLEKAAKQFEQTSRLAEQWAREGQERVTQLSPEVKEFAADNNRAGNRWLAGYTLAQAADARLEKAWIYNTQHKAALRDAEVLATAAEALDLPEVDADAERTKAAEAKKSGVEEITLAMTALQKAHRDVGSHWTVTAQGAGTTYVMALFGETEYAQDALEGYRSAIKGRENEPYAETFAQRVRELEAAQGR